jgi:hypothetical protein
MVGLLMLTSCNDYDVINNEQYKHVFAFISDANHINGNMFNLADSASTGYIAISMGGSTPTDEDTHINIVEDQSILTDYNQKTYDVNIEKYARMLPKDKYSISSFTCTLKAGEPKGSIPVTIRPDGLSPDSTYFIPLRIDSYDKYEVNRDQNYLLYQVQIKNQWAKGDGTSIYTMMASRTQSGYVIHMPGSKALYPIASRTVRTMAGNEDFSANVRNAEKYGILIDIADDGKLTIRPFRDLELKQVMDTDDNYDADYPNKYFLDNTEYGAYRTFLLHYLYKAADGTWYEMKEELRMKVTE